MTYRNLTAPLQIGTRTFKNRIVMPPLVIWQSGETGEVEETHLKHYASCAGPGLIIVEATTVSPDGKLHENQLGVFADRHVEGLTRLADTIRSTGAIPGIQIHHAGGRSTPKTNWGAAPLAPSTDGAIRPVSRECRVLSTSDIRRIQEEFTSAARRAVTAGFELIELHGAHAYLGSQFLSPLSNTRTDAYGGSLENRQRFLVETFVRCREAIGDKALLSCRLGVIDQDPSGLTLEEGINTARRLEAEGADLLHISCGHKVPDTINGVESTFNPLLRLAELVRPHLAIPVIGVGGLVDPEYAEEALKLGMADMVAVGRGILADPQWALKVVEGHPEKIYQCIRCSPCFWYTRPDKCPQRKKAGKENAE